jgi:ABC-2 type transport system permease protein
VSTLIVLAAFLRRDWGIRRSYRMAFVLTSLSAGFHLAIYFFIGRLVDRTDLGSFEGMGQGYFPFVLLGTVMVNLVSTSMSTFSTTLRTEQTTGSLEALLATPASPSLLIIGTALYGFVQALINAGILVALAVVIFGVRVQVGAWSVLIAVAAFLGALVFFAATGVAIAGFTVVFKQTGPIAGLALYGLQFLGGVFFPIDVLPTPLRWLAWAVPFSWALQALRSALLDGEARPLLLVPLAAATVIVVPVSFWIFNTALRHARRAGSLNQY